MLLKKRLVISIILLSIGILSISVFAQKSITGEPTAEGRFTLANEPPTIVANSFGVKDCGDVACGGDYFDHGIVADDEPINPTSGIIDTHSVPSTATGQATTVTTFEWKTNDVNVNSPMNTKVCISTDNNFVTCEVFDRTVTTTTTTAETRSERSYSCTTTGAAGCTDTCTTPPCTSQTAKLDFSGTSRYGTCQTGGADCTSGSCGVNGPCNEDDNLDCATDPTKCLKRYYIQLTPNDGIVDGTPAAAQFYLINRKPSTPTAVDISPSNDGDNALTVNLNFNTAAESCGAAGVPDCSQESHSQTPNLIWTLSDLDDGDARNEWPKDSLIRYSLVGSDSARSTPHEYMDNTAAGIDSGTSWTPTDTITTAIPWEISPFATDGVSRTTTYGRISIADQHNAGNPGVFRSANYDPNIYIADYLPTVLPPNQATPSSAGVTLMEPGQVGGPLSCNTLATAASPCIINPTQPTNFDGASGYSGIAATIRSTDIDQDCSDASHNINLYLCQDTTICSSTFAGNRYDFVDGTSMAYISGTGAKTCSVTTTRSCSVNTDCPGVETCTTINPCVFQASHPVGTATPRTIEYFVPTATGPNDYRLDIVASSQAGSRRDADPNRGLFWELGILDNVRYYQGATEGANYKTPASIVLLGGGTGVTTSAFNPGTNQYIVLNQGNIKQTLDWKTTQFCGKKTLTGDSIPPDLITIWPNQCNTVSDVANDGNVWVVFTEHSANDFQIDDDNVYGGGDGTNENPTGINGVDTNYKFPSLTSTAYTSGQIQLCSNIACTTPATAQVLTYFHIWPAGPPLVSDDYGSIIDITDA